MRIFSLDLECCVFWLVFISILWSIRPLPIWYFQNFVLKLNFISFNLKCLLFRKMNSIKVDFVLKNVSLIIKLTKLKFLTKTSRLETVNNTGIVVQNKKLQFYLKSSCWKLSSTIVFCLVVSVKLHQMDDSGLIKHHSYSINKRRENFRTTVHKDEMKYIVLIENH